LPFKSKAEQRFAYAHPEKFGGETGLAEWSAATDFSHLPERAGEKREGKKVGAKHWMQAESQREKHAGTKGAFKRKAQRAHMSTSEFAQHVTAEGSHASTKTKRQAGMAKAYAAARG
jgi:hypothetical protein